MNFTHSVETLVAFTLKNYFVEGRITQTGDAMKLIRIGSMLVIILAVFQSCGSVPRHTATHIHEGGERFGSADTALPFDQQSELTSQTGFKEQETESSEESKLDKNKEADAGIIFMPVSIGNGFPITARMLRFCETLFEISCTHLFIQSGQPNRLPAAPVSYSDEPSNE